MQVSEALQRLKFEELFFLQLMILRYARSNREGIRGFLFSRIGQSFLDFYNLQLPFELTDAQKG